MDTSVSYSNGRGKSGRIYAYIRPVRTCFQHSRRVGGYTSKELEEAIDKCIAKHFTPMHYYQIEGRLIGSSSAALALKEYWRVCDRKDIGKPFPVTLIETNPHP